MIRKLVKALVLIPLAIVLVALAVANRQVVTVSFDPFDSTEPAFSVSLPLYGLVLLLVIAGVIVGGIAAWLGQRHWRRRARLAEVQTREVRAENERLKRREPAALPSHLRSAAPEPRLTIPPPAA
ncbi:MAG: DUF1049 domain-containing protein [Hyphomicrobiales bacterium]|nr:DUF1049 domain-containing protein [Hyphomicrobiales bacterium]